MKKDGNHVWEPVDEVMVTRTKPGQIPDDEMDAFIADLRSNKRIKVVFAVVSGTVSITAVQRKAVAEVLKSRSIRAVVLTDAAVTRGIITAISWLGGNMKGFGWSEVDKALDYTNASPSAKDRLRTIAAEFKRQLSES